MHIKFLDSGAGSALDAAEYLLAVKDAKGELRAGVEILRGDLYQLAALADSLDFKYRYSSVVVSFHPDDMPTAEQLQELIDEFEKTAFAGLDPEQYSWSVVRHDDNAGGFHLHILIARVELRTGKAFNPAPPGWQKIFDPLRDYFNAKYGWKSPDIDAHPENARDIQLGHRVHKNVRTAVKSGIEDPREIITEYIMTGIVNGFINNRQEMLTYLKEAGFIIPRAGKNYITVMEPSLELDNRWRLKGALFHEEFIPERALATEAASRDGVDRKPDPSAAEKFFRQLEKKRGKRAQYNQKYYQRTKNKGDHRHQRTKSIQSAIKEEMETDLANPINGESFAFTDSYTPSSVRTLENRADENRDRQTATGIEQPQDSSEKYGNKKLRWKAMCANQRSSRHLQQRVPNSQAINKNVITYERLQIQLLGDILPFNDIQYIDLNRGILRFNDSSYIEVSKFSLIAKKMSDEKAAIRLIFGAKAKHWQAIKLTGSLEFFNLAAELAFEAGIDVIPQTPQQKIIMEKIYERERINRARETIAQTVKKSEQNQQRIGESTDYARKQIGRISFNHGLTERRLTPKQENLKTTNGRIDLNDKLDGLFYS